MKRKKTKRNRRRKNRAWKKKRKKKTTNELLWLPLSVSSLLAGEFRSIRRALHAADSCSLGGYFKRFCPDFSRSGPKGSGASHSSWDCDRQRRESRGFKHRVLEEYEDAGRENLHCQRRWRVPLQRARSQRRLRNPRGTQRSDVVRSHDLQLRLTSRHQPSSQARS